MTAHKFHRVASRGQTLLFDADDTLWENNIYFERAIAAFISYLDHRVHTPEEVREHLNRVERATITGPRLRPEELPQVAGRTASSSSPTSRSPPEKHARIVSFAESIADQRDRAAPRRGRRPWPSWPRATLHPGHQGR